MKLAYVIGPYRAQNAWEREQNIRRAEEVALELWRLGFAVICPHTNTRFFDGAADDSIWLAGDLEILRRCDLAVVIPGWDKSRGSRAEIYHEVCPPVFMWPENREVLERLVRE